MKQRSSLALAYAYWHLLAWLLATLPHVQCSCSISRFQRKMSLLATEEIEFEI